MDEEVNLKVIKHRMVMEKLQRQIEDEKYQFRQLLVTGFVLLPSMFLLGLFIGFKLPA